jgi:hypothetical protein
MITSCLAVQDMYPMLVLAAGCMELLGGVLFTLNLKLGAFLLVRRRSQHSAIVASALISVIKCCSMY